MGLSFKSLAKAIVRVVVHAAVTFALTATLGPWAGTAYAYSALSYETSRALRPSMAGAGGTGRKRGYEVTQRGSTISHQIIYGKMKVAGARIFDGTTGTDNVDLHRVVAFAGHEIESFEEIYINDEVATINSSGTVTSPSRYQGKIKIYQHLGSPNQAADSNLVSAVSGWTGNHRLRGIAYLYCKFTYDVDAFPNNVPEITAVIKGKKVYDPRTSTTAWSDNPALCARDYLTATGYGLGEATANINDTAFITAANICDETNTDAGTTRYTANGAFTTGIEPQELIADLMTSMGGTIWYNQGYWNVKAAKWTAPVLDLNEDDLRSGLNLSTRHSRRDNFNSVKGTFRGSESNWVVTDFPPVTNAAFVTADNGQESSIDYDLPWTDNSIEARRTARIVLERNRQQLTLTASFGLRAFQVQTGDNVRITNTRLGWTNKEFEVVGWTFGLQNQYDLQVEMTLREISESVFDEVNDGIVYERDNTTLLSPFTVPTLGLTLGSELRRIKGKVLGVMTIDVTNTANIMDTAEVQYRKVGDTNYTSLGTIGAFVGTDRVEVVGIEDGFYDVRARATNSLGVHGPYNTLANQFVEPLGAPPADVTNVSGNLGGGNLFLSWTPVPDLDLAHYIIRYSKAISGALYNSSVLLAEVPSNSSTLSLSDAGPGTYFIKAVDDTASGSNSSVNAAKFVITSVGMEELNVVATLTEHPSFSGVKSNVVKADNKLLLISELFDSATGDFDDRPNNFDTVTTFESSGIYYFANNFDIGFKATCRLGYSFDSTRFNNADTFDLQSTLFDSTAGEFDTIGSDADDTSVTLELRHTDDDPSGTPTWTDWQSFSVSDITARAFEFRAILGSTTETSSPQISELSVEVDMPDRVESGSDITFTGTTNVTFTNAFANVPAIGISLADMTDGDRYTITNKSRTGFTMNIFTGSSASTNAVTLDYVAKGYGNELT
jgi:hypothetical protein